MGDATVAGRSPKSGQKNIQSAFGPFVMFLIGSEPFWQAGADLDERMNIFWFLAARASGKGWT